MTPAPFATLYAIPSRNGVSVPKGDRSSGVQMINMGELFKYRRIGDAEMARVPLNAEDLAKSLVEPGDLLFARRSLQLAGAGKCSLVVEASEPRTFESSIIRVRLNAERACPEYYYYFFTSDVGRQVMETIVEQAVVAGIRASDLRGLDVPTPSIDEQRAIAETLRMLDDKIESNGCIIRIASDLLDALSATLTETLPSIPLGHLVTVERTAVDPKVLADEEVDHFSLPAFDDGALPERVAASTIMSGKLAVTMPSILVSRLNPRFNRTWWALPATGVPALASTEFACLTTRGREDLAAVWLAVRDEYFRAELVRRAGGTSGSHQRVRPNDLLAIDVPDVRELSQPAKSDALTMLDLIHERRIESTRLAVLRDTLLPELLSGRIRAAEAARANLGRA